jgi:mono/diheme cytochrome c family protein
VKEGLAPRAARIDALFASFAGGAPPPEAGWYRTREYLAPYQCAACHTYAGKAEGVPK